MICVQSYISMSFLLLLLVDKVGTRRAVKIARDKPFAVPTLSLLSNPPRPEPPSTSQRFFRLVLVHKESTQRA
ncbi:uncharacterized protein BDZ99DRAFT_82714 [Mytilinidion resinicola]|uniref:Secreted protein n=1 Tax=Mytilinidion resinicola TaxID=574789 RepID=A0A6A6YF59_9PEZI|nr:uncharacterized protein BDZ99DRAFT_82714 [Mytilinidion resinicola]KAF2806654.1 hypothetical protein BDZ99DRAFT_82714 [Mytilinidion resinicola]